MYLTVFDHEIAEASDSIFWIDTVLGDLESRLDDISGLIPPRLPTTATLAGKFAGSVQRPDPVEGAT
jgi:hypothetical protein